jgi:23S rRNA G2069 N7-methylase RlmK/C1962 C5-methylase RlmI
MSAEERVEAQAAMLRNRLRKNRTKLGRWAKKRGITCFRMYDIDIPEIPLVIDWYEGRLHITEHVTRRRPEGEEGERWLDAMALTARDALDVPEADVFVKQRRRQRGDEQYQRHDDGGHRFVVEEGGLKFRVNLSDYHDTGLFLDHRETRHRVAAEAAGKRVLNLFSYTGSFSVYAAAAGARTTTSIDLSKTYLAWSRENFSLNGLSIGPSHQLIHADVLDWLSSPARRDDWYDLVVVDPPTWSTSKRMRDTLDVQRDHATLLQDAVRLTAPGGVIYFSTNRRKFVLEDGAFSGTRATELTAETVPDDFRARRPHRCWRAVREQR